MSGNRRISSLAVPVVASLDPSSKDAMQKFGNLMRLSAEEAQQAFTHLAPRVRNTLVTLVDEYGVHVDKVVNQAAASMARIGKASESHVNRLREVVVLTNELGDSTRHLAATRLLDVAEGLNITSAIKEARTLQGVLAEIREPFGKGDVPLPTSMASQVRGQYDYDGNGRLGMLPRTVPISPATKAADVEESRRKWLIQMNREHPLPSSSPGLSGMDALNEQAEHVYKTYARNALSASRAEAPDQIAQTQLAERRRDIDDATEQRNADLALRLANKALAEARLREVRESERFITTGILGAARNSAVSPQFHFRDAQHFMTADQQSLAERYGSRGMFSGLSKGGSHSIRFAAQNIGFGVDDAIQSYQYGGAGASIRAASNNATAIAGMLISSPMIAAASVIAISAASAALPIILRNFGVQNAFQDLKHWEKTELQQRDPDLYQKQKRIAEFGDDTARQMSTGKHWSAGEAAFNKIAQQGGFASLLGDKHDELIQRDVASGWLKNEKRELEKENARLHNAQLGHWWSDPTAVKAMEKNQDRIDTIAKERKNLGALNESDRDQMAKFEQKIPVLMELHRAKTIEGTVTQDLLSQGGLSEQEYKERIRVQARHDKAMAKVSATSPVEYKAAERRIHQQMLEDMDNPNISRMINLSKHDATADRRRFDSGLLPQNNFTNVQNQFRDAFHALNRRGINGSLDPEEVARRQSALTANAQIMGSRAFADDIDSLNPERNPLKRLQTSMGRTTEDIQRMDITPEGKRQLMLAHLRGRTRDMEDAMTPSGTRQYISQGYKIGSLEDEALRSRMVGNFGPVEKKEDHANKTLDQLLDEMKKLSDKLTFEAAKLGA